MNIFSPAPTGQYTTEVPTDADVYAAVKTEQETHAAMIANKNDDTTAEWCAAFRRLRFVQEARRRALVMKAGV